MVQKPRISVITPSIRPDGLEMTRQTLALQSFKDFEHLVMLDEPGEHSTLCAAMNRGVKMARGELIVFLQDFITVLPDGLQRFWDDFEKDKSVAWTAPVAKFNGSALALDWRSHGEERDIKPEEWEIDWGCISRRAVMEVGGFDLDYDRGFGWENVDLAARMAKRDLRFRLDPLNTAVAIDHDKLVPHPWKHQPNDTLWSIKKQLIEAGDVVLPYLKEEV